MRFTWTNVTERWILVSNCGMTCNGLCELHTLDQLRHVSALPENRLRRRHVLKYATPLPCIRRLTFRWILSQFLITSLPRFPRSIVTFIGDRFSFLPISLFQHSHSTFVIILFRFFCRLFINLTMCEWALFPKPTTTLGLVVQAFWRVPFSTKWVIASSFEVILARPSRRSTAGAPASGTSGPRWFSLILLHERIRRRIWWCNFSWWLSGFLPFAAMWSSWYLYGTPSNLILIDLSASTLQAYLVSRLPLLRQVFPRQFTGVYKALLASEFPTFYERSFMVCLNSSSFGSMKKIPRNLLALSSFSFSIPSFALLYFSLHQTLLPHIWRYIVWSWGCLFPRKSPPGPCTSVRWPFAQKNESREAGPCIW